MADTFDAFDPDADALLRRISDHVDTQMLREIAAADYGEEVEEHLEHLLGIRDRGSFEMPMSWHPQEVLELIRWSEPEDPSWRPGAPGERGHWMRAFACAALLRAAGEESNDPLRDGWNQTLIQLLESLRIVGTPLYGHATGFLAWLIPRALQYKDAEDLGFFMIGLLWCALHRPTAVSDTAIVLLSEQISAEMQRASNESRRLHAEPGLLGATYYDLRHAKWRQLGQDLIKLDLTHRALAVQEWVGMIGGELGASG